MQSPMLPPRRGRDIVVGQVLPGSPLLDALPRPTSVIHNRYRQGGICLCATKDGTPIGYIWFNLGPYEEDEVRCRFAPTPAGRSSWDYDVYVAPQYRGSFTFARLWDAANEHLRERRVDWSMSRISAFNAESLASHSRLQAQRVGTATFLEIGRIQLMFSSLPPRFDVSWNPRRRPQLDVPAPEASHHKG